VGRRKKSLVAAGVVILEYKLQAVEVSGLSDEALADRISTTSQRESE
jgi:hypothetical protein